VALAIERAPGQWVCERVAPSVEGFVSGRVDWTARPRGSAIDVEALLSVVPRGARLTVAVDMPVGKTPPVARRASDNAVTRAFGRYGCGTHSPTPERPGPLSVALTRAFARRGLPIAAANDVPAGRLLEVYPHPAVMALLGRDYRVPYKVSRASKYWPGTTPTVRAERILAELRALRDALATRLPGAEVPLPARVRTLAELKRYEDALDALVCAFIGVEVVEGRGRAWGDANAAIWLPERRSEGHDEPGRRR
jgi:predicted RNase H-like nuclease